MDKLKPWPDPYTTHGKTSPSLTREECILLGGALAHRLVVERLNLAAADFAPFYLRIVKNYFRKHDDELSNYRDMITDARDAAKLKIDLSHFNEHDFANVQRAAWLTIVRAITRLVSVNPFDSHHMESNPWLDPEPGCSAREVSAVKNPHLFFGVPNRTGSYALTNADFDAFWGTLTIPPPLPEPV
ncbi:MAG TPA: hypothetical protein VK665_12005 [Candidatus Elarobacter sp.]|nr:hypothetical protein [Candidatus Elarobacter sp.]